MNTAPYLTEKINRHSKAIEQLKKDMLLEGSEFFGYDIESAIAFDAADFVWAFLGSLGYEEANETREIRNEIAYRVKTYLKSKDLKCKVESVKVVHPKPDDSGTAVEIVRPAMETSFMAWKDSTQIATVTPAGKVPRTLNGLQLDSWITVPKQPSQWSSIDGKHGGLFDEPLYVPVPGKRAAAGVVIEEIDGRVWVIHPTNAYAGYDMTFPKGEIGKVDSMQAAAIREAYLKTGLKITITGYCGDYERGGTKTRYYFARRVGGSPADMGWKAQAVSLVPLPLLKQVLRHPNDKKLVEALIAEMRPARRDIIKYQFGLTSGHRIVAVLNSFRKRFGDWPCRLLIGYGMASALQEEVLTPLGWEMLNERLELVIIEDAELIAVGVNGEQCDYSSDACELHSDQKPRADEWLWGITVQST